MCKAILIVSLVILCLFGAGNTARAQLSKTFWFVAPDLSAGHEQSPIVMRLVNGNATAATVTISEPANPSFTPVTLTLPANQLTTYTFATNLAADLPKVAQVEDAPPDQVNHFGILITSDSYISAYYEESGSNNPAIYALKGDNALGTSFLIPGQDLLNNVSTVTPLPYNSFHIVATQNNTTVTITPSNTITGHAAGVPFTVTLNKGQTYAAVATSQLAANHLGGSIVTSDKPVAVTICDDSMYGTPLGGTCYNEGGDQLVPNSLLGKSYIAIRGDLGSTTALLADYIFIRATEPNTKVYIGGVLVSTLASVGDLYRYKLAATIGNACYITSDKNISVLQMTGYGCETDMAILAQLDCTGSHAVTLARSTTEHYALDVLVQAGGQGYFTVSTSSGTGAVLNASDFAVVPGSGGAYYYAKKEFTTAQVPLGATITVKNSKYKFHIGMINGGSTSGCRFGYFSDYASAILQFTPKSVTACQGDNVVLQPTLYESRIDDIATIQYAWNVPDGSGGRMETPATTTATAYTITNAKVTDSGYYVAQAFDNGCATNGIDTVTVKINPTYDISETVSVCSNMLPYTYRSDTVFKAGTVSGLYTLKRKTINGCDSIRRLNLIINVPTMSITYDTICDNDPSPTFNGAPYNQTNVYPAYFTNKAGCDSIAYFNLTVLKHTESTVNIKKCSQGFPFSYHGLPISSPGTYKPILRNKAGCDSLVTLNVTMIQPDSSFISRKICFGDSTYFINNYYKTAGPHSVTVQNTDGCDSVSTLILSLKYPSALTLRKTICRGDSAYIRSFLPRKYYKTTGVYADTLVNKVGCDSIITLILTVNEPSPTIVITKDICPKDLPYHFSNEAPLNAGGTYPYHYLNTAGCDSSVTLILNVKHTSSSITNSSICRGDSVLFNGSWYKDSGPHPITLTNAVGCDSTATLQITIKEPSVYNLTKAICRGDTTWFNHTPFTEAGTYTYHYTNAVGCDSAFNLIIQVKEPTSSVSNLMRCTGQPTYIFHGMSCDTTGTYKFKLPIPNKAGCDSTDILHMTILNSYNIDINKKICVGDSVYFNTQWRKTTDTYTASYTSAGGCDSIVNLHLTVLHPGTSTTLKTICQGGSVLFNDSVYSKTGTYTRIVKTIDGCDSTAILKLTVNPVSSYDLYVTQCEGQGGYWFGNHHYTDAGYHTDTAVQPNKYGCDSTTTLHLTILKKTSSTVTMRRCKADFPFTYHGQPISTSGTYPVTIPNAVGCDSSITLIVTMLNPATSYTYRTICQGDSTLFNHKNYKTADYYPVTVKTADGCDSTATLVLKVIPYTTSTTIRTICQGDSVPLGSKYYKIAGTFTDTLVNKAGCDSIATLTLKVNRPSSYSYTVTRCRNALPYIIPEQDPMWNAKTYTYHYTNAAGCDSTLNVTLVIKEVSTNTITAQICEGGSYRYNNTPYTTAGTRTFHYTNSIGCDSTVSLTIIVNKKTASVTDTAICRGQGFRFSGKMYYTAKDTTLHFVNKAGCDSTATLKLRIKEPTQSTTTISICPKDTIYFNGQKCFKVGTYKAILTNKAGCDSTAYLNLAFLPVSSSSIDTTICYGTTYLYHGKPYKQSDVYVVHLQNSVGCDSAVTIHLKVLPPASSFIYANICMGETYTFNHTDYGASGRYSASYTSKAGCDSTSTLILTVNPTYYRTQMIRLPQGDTYAVNGHIYGSSGTYTDTLRTKPGCDSIVVTTLAITRIVNTFTPNGDGKNDRFMAGWSLKVYNRNGLKLYDGTDGWDGKYNGRAVSQDTYFYILLYEFEGKKRSREGYVVVVH